VERKRQVLVAVLGNVVISITACKSRVHLTRWTPPPTTSYTHVWGISQSSLHDHIKLTNSKTPTYFYIWRIHPTY